MKPTRKTLPSLRSALRGGGRSSSPRFAGQCPIVGVGASAGGLEAFTQLLKRLPPDTGFGFVLVQHLDPQHESALAQLLTPATRMPVCEVTDNLRVKANHVYIIPPNASLGIARGVLKLQPRARTALAARAIDNFFEALAKDQHERAIGVILSGNATDGTLGLEAIKAEGGLTFAQDGSARYDSMPRSAAAAGCVDRVLSPAGIASELARISRHPWLSPAAPDVGKPPRSRGRAPATAAGRSHVFRALAAELEPDAPQDRNGQYQRIVSLLSRHSGVDFSLYKSATIQRRIVRRAVLNQRNTLADYAAFLRANPGELDALYADALINVTSFFRNADAFAVLRDRVFAKLLRQRTVEPVRAWVLGCSTGQEAYSIAMAYAEAAGKIRRARKLQMFATDLNEANLDKARHGFYARALVQDVSPARLRRFFVEEKGGYRVIKSLRESVVFARQNVIGDPPFSRLDLISCRNLMIYLEAGLQKRLFPAFHYALKPGGFLFLGASESIGNFGDLFFPVDKKRKIFAQKAAPLRAFYLPPANRGRAPVPPPRAARMKGKNYRRQEEVFRSGFDAEREADRLVLNRFAPAGVLVNADLQIVQFRGSTSAYLEPPTGKATFDLLRMARDGLMLPLRAAIGRAMKENKVARQEAVPLALGGKTRMVNLEVIPLRNLKETCYLVLFGESERRLPGEGPSPGPPKGAARLRFSAAGKDDTSRVAGLERDLAEARDYLHSVQEHSEAATEELQASNEEGQSANEELQSLNEELETSKEELESTNEELTTVNEEMVSRNAELNGLIAARKRDEETLRANEERFRALFNLGPVGVYSCDNRGRVQEFNRCAVELWGRKPKVSDRAEKFCGSFKLRRPNGTILPRARCPMADVLRGKIAEARDAEAIIERPDGSRITVVANIVPLKNDRGETTGAINCFYDVTARKQAEEALRQAQIQLSQHAGKLEGLVEERTAELTATNQRLESSVISIRKGQEEYRSLLAESRVMQEKLRYLTRQIIIAQEEERKAISRELHDSVVQTLIGINVELTALRAGKAVEPGELTARIVQSQKLVEDSVAAVHRFARGLRPAVLDDLGLIPALHAFCQGLSSQKRLNIHLTAFQGLEALDDTGKTVLFRVAQEALNNVLRHAHATRVKVDIAEMPGLVRMEIRDNGQSFNVDRIFRAKNPRRLGLVGMKERVEMIGGKLTIRSAAGLGTVVQVNIPFTVGKGGT
ncbi:MAG TPA: chemotaxis protein CheB [Opitutaceae bacterium]|jgi:two-component system CheB/CheR fusion protein|nr:chemotaxis protein CheB [Opitutaceae bacterium]